jgi:Na+:H+ antiporter
MTDPVAPIVAVLAVVIVAGKLAGELAVRLRQPAVLGELLAGMILGNVRLHWFEAVRTDPIVDVLAGIGVLILLFQVGVASTVSDMLQVGWSAFVVAVVGVVAPFALGWGVGAWLLPDAGILVHAFLGATLSATSVGITARVLQDLGAARRPEARIILGAAVVDDVLGLMILSVVSGSIVATSKGQPFSWTAVALIVLEAATFLLGAIVLGRTAVPRLFTAAARFKTTGVLLALSLSLCFALAWLASRVGLAPIVGAFAAGLILEDAHYRDFAARGEQSVDNLLQPLADFLVPVFFVLMGMRTDLRVLANPAVVGLATALTVAAIAGKQVCGLGVLKRGVDRLSVGIGMIPRGEVGLIFANVGLGLTLNGRPVMGSEAFSAVVVMVFATTMVTPPALKWSLSRRRGRRGMTQPAA